MYFVYVLECKDGSLYTGITNDLERRLKMHKKGIASRYTRARGAKKMIYTEKRRTRGAALKREAAIKKLSRGQKLLLVANK